MGSWLFGSAGATQASITYSQLRVQTALVGQAIPIGWGQNRLAPNLIDYDDFHAQTSSSSKGGGKGGLFSTGQQATYYATSILALCEGPINTIVGVFNASGYTANGGKGGKNSTTILPNATGEISLAAMGYTLFNGDYAQSPWNFMVTAHPTKALGYRGTAYICQAGQNLGSSPELPMVNLDILFGINNATSVVPSGGTASSKTNIGTATNAIIQGTPDVNPADVIIDLLTNPFYGVPGWPSNIIGDQGTSRTAGTFSSNLLSTFWNYCQAYGLLISPILSDQQTASDFLSEILKFSNSEAIFSQGQLIIVPYGDVSLTGNGGTYVAPQQQLFDIFDDDLVSKNPDDAVSVTRLDVTGQLNDIRVSYLNRGFDYNPDTPMEAKDDAAILQYGLRPNDAEQWDFVCLPNAAQNAAQLMLQRQKIVTTFKFTVDQSFIVLDPMDIIALYVPQQGLLGDGKDGQWVRLKEIQENPDYTLTITAEVYLEGTGSAPEFGNQPNQSTGPNFGVQPGNVNPPILWEPTLELSDAMEVWCAVSGQEVADWGGCAVWVSTDNVTYAQVPGIQIGPARMGVLAANLPTFGGAEGALDTTDTLAVDLTESGGQLVSGSDSDAQALATLCYVDREYIAYANSSAFGTDEYNLSYLVRGNYGTSGIMNTDEHLTGAPFARLDSQIFKIPYNQSQIGQAIFIKFLSFNLVGAQSQTLDQVEPYQYTIIGLAGGLTTLEDFAATGVVAAGANGGQIPAIQCTWLPIENAAIIGVVFEYYVQGGDPTQSTQVTCNNPAAGIFLILAGLQPGTTYEIRATITTAPDNLLPSSWTAYVAVTTPNILTTIGNLPPGVPAGLTLANVRVQVGSGFEDGFAAGWQAVTSVNVASYVLRYSTDGGNTWTTIGSIAATSDQVLGLSIGQVVDVQVASLSNLGAQSAWSGTASITISGTAATPNGPSDLVATPGLHEVLLQWINPANPDLDFIQLWRGTSDNLSAATNVLDVDAPASSAVDINLNAGTNYFYWIRAVNSSGVLSPFNTPATSGTAATTLQVNGATDIVAGSVIADNIGATQITAAKMATNSITAANAALAAASVGTANIQNLAVNTLQIAGNAVTAPMEQQTHPTVGTGVVAALDMVTTVTGVAGQSAAILAMFQVAPDSSNQTPYDIGIQLDGINIWAGSGTGTQQFFASAFLLNMTGAPQTIEVVFDIVFSSGAIGVLVQGVVLTAMR